MPPTDTFFSTPCGSVCANAETATIIRRIVLMRMLIATLPPIGGLTLSWTWGRRSCPAHGFRIKSLPATRSPVIQRKKTGPLCQFGFAVWPAATRVESSCRLLFRHSHAQSLGHWRDGMVTLSGTSRTVLLRSVSTTRLSAPEHHRYVRFLDWTVACEFNKPARGRADHRRQAQVKKLLKFIFRSCERLRVVGPSGKRRGRPVREFCEPIRAFSGKGTLFRRVGSFRLRGRCGSGRLREPPHRGQGIRRSEARR